MDKPACLTCQFFKKPLTQTTAYGLCVRYPTPIEHNETHWCGEYKPKAEGVKISEPKARR